MERKAIIIGGGMAGLCAGTYLRMNGLETDIFEMHHTAGGVCTSWKRDDYLIDFCIHWLVGSAPTDPFYERWSELLDMESIAIVDHEEYMRVEDEEGKQLIIYTSLDRLEEELLSKAPEDKREIVLFVSAIRKLTGMELASEKASELASLWDKAKMLWNLLPYMGVFSKYMRLPAREYARRFQNPLLRKAMEIMFEPDMAVVFQMMTLAWMHKKAAGYPIGGSLRFANRILKRYRKLGGRIHLEKKVAEILVEEDKAVGIRLEDGSEHFADYIISAADGYSTHFKMLNGNYLTPELENWYSKMATFPSVVFVALGIDQALVGEPHALYFPLREPIQLDPETCLTHLPLRIHNFDHTLAPAGKTLVTVTLETFHTDYWTRLYQKDPSRYYREKERISQAVIRALESRISGIAENVEMADVATPATFFRYTGNWKGSFEGWMLTPEAGLKSLGHELPNLENFYMCGQWVEVGGGLPTVLISGRAVAQLICHAEGKPFEVIRPKSEFSKKDMTPSL
jgi:phytoene dehydrogenase-like protein